MALYCFNKSKKLIEYLLVNLLFQKENSILLNYNLSHKRTAHNLSTHKTNYLQNAPSGHFYFYSHILHFTLQACKKIKPDN
jgi:hypothetical protein